LLVLHGRQSVASKSAQIFIFLGCCKQFAKRLFHPPHRAAQFLGLQQLQLIGHLHDNSVKREKVNKDFGDAKYFFYPNDTTKPVLATREPGGFFVHIYIYIYLQFFAILTCFTWTISQHRLKAVMQYAQTSLVFILRKAQFYCLKIGSCFKRGFFSFFVFNRNKRHLAPSKLK
jgi:hypothetical protein